MYLLHTIGFDDLLCLNRFYSNFSDERWRIFWATCIQQWFVSGHIGQRNNASLNIILILWYTDKSNAPNSGNVYYLERDSLHAQRCLPANVNSILLDPSAGVELEKVASESARKHFTAKNIRKHSGRRSRLQGNFLTYNGEVNAS